MNHVYLFVIVNNVIHIVMKSGKCLLMLLMILFSPMAFAQQSGVNVTGSVVEQGSDTPIEQATVRLLNVKDSAMVRGVVSARNGSFTLKNVKKGSYLLHITFIGYDPLYQPLQITGKKNPVNVGKLELSDGAIELGEAVVIGKAPEVTVRNDTVEYNADSYKVTEGSVLEDLLKKMPGVEVDSEGKITVNGKEVKKVMVDGKEFFSDDPKVASKNLPAKMIDKLQVLDKKSDMAQMTGFDDGEEETVINLTVKPGMKQGWFGNAYGGYGSKDRYEGNAMVNRFVNNDQITFMGGTNNTNNMGFSDLASTMFSGMGGGGGRRGGFGAGSGITSSGNAGLNFSKEFKPDKLTLGGNTRYSHSDNDARSKSDRQNILPGDSSSYDNSEAMSRTKSDNFGVDFRLEWKPDTMTQLIFRPSFSLSHSMNDNFSDATTLDNERDTVNTNKSSNYSESNGYNLNASIDFSRKLNNKGRVFSATLSGGNSDSYSDGMNRSDIVYFNQTDALKNSIIDQRSRYDNKGFNYRAYVSWVEPIGHNNFIQATYSISQRKQEALKNVYNQDADGIYNVLDSAYNQSYRNNFISQRASLSFKSQRAKFNYTIGLNLDPSYSSSENFVGDTTLSKITRKVVNLSPMAQFNYMFDKRTNLRIMYNGRTSQPSMTQLQPVADISDPTNITIGNPDLKWQITQDKNIGMDLTLFNSRFSLTVDYFHKLTDPLLIRVTMPYSSGTTEYYTNAGEQVSQGITFSTVFHILRDTDRRILWSVRANGRTQKTRIDKIGNKLDVFNNNGRGTRTQRYYDGADPDDIWVIKSAGIDPSTGKELFFTKEGGFTYDFSYDNEVICGNTRPDIEGVIGSSFTYKGLTLSLNFRYQLGADVFNSALLNKVENVNLYYNQDRRALYERWQNPGDIRIFKNIRDVNSSPMSSRFVQREDVLALESLYLEYEFMGGWIKQVGLSNLKVFCSMRDVFRFSTIRSERGIDYPFARSIDAGLSFNF